MDGSVNTKRAPACSSSGDGSRKYDFTAPPDCPLDSDDEYGEEDDDSDDSRYGKNRMKQGGDEGARSHRPSGRRSSSGRRPTTDYKGQSLEEMIALVRRDIKRQFELFPSHDKPGRSSNVWLVMLVV